MIKVKIGNASATLTGSNWQCSDASILKALTVLTEPVLERVHGGVPNAEVFIVGEISKEIPLTIVEEPATPTDNLPEGVIF